LIEDWKFQSALAYYREDGRIQAIEPVISAVRDLSDGGKLAFNFIAITIGGFRRKGEIALGLGEGQRMTEVECESSRTLFNGTDRE